jgi:hypothetical protein
MIKPEQLYERYGCFCTNLISLEAYIMRFKNPFIKPTKRDCGAKEAKKAINESLKELDNSINEVSEAATELLKVMKRQQPIIR